MSTCQPEFTIHVGAVAPYSLTFSVSGSAFDLSGTTAVYMRIWRQAASGPDDYDEYLCQSFSATSSTCSGEYIYQAGDLPVAERIKVTMRIVTPAGDVFATPKNGLVDHMVNLATCVST